MTREAPRAFVALGANLGDPASQLRAAVRELADLAPVLARSSIYLSPALGGPRGQPDYLNAVVVLAADAWLGREERLLAGLLAIEERLGRVRRERWGPRHIDLDLLDVAGTVRLGPELRLPHPRMEERAFVLVPLAEVAPEWRHPLSGRRVTDALVRVANEASPWRADW